MFHSSFNFFRAYSGAFSGFTLFQHFIVGVGICQLQLLYTNLSIMELTGTLSPEVVQVEFKVLIISNIPTVLRSARCILMRIDA